MIVCSGIFARCYLLMQPITGLVLDAGCVEPTTSLTMLTSHNAHLCYRNYKPYGGCFEPLVLMPNRISCFICAYKQTRYSSCQDPRDLDVSNRSSCGTRAKYCITYVFGNTVSRGCDDKKSPVSKACARQPSMCLYCGTNYCNGLRMQANPAKCYSTMSHVPDLESTTLRLKRCEDRLPAHTKQPCFIARKQNSPVIMAGCIEDYMNSTDYAIVLQGGTEVIFQQKFYCYKCKSANSKSCFNVRWHEPQLCTGYGGSALRGCYTLFDLAYERIERGCLSELDSYRVGICLATHFEELCITCAQSYCNIDTI